MRVFGLQTQARNESKGVQLGALRWDPSGAPPAGCPYGRFEQEHICLDPKDGELCLSRVKPGETLVEARSDTDVQIVRQTWV